MFRLLFLCFAWALPIHSGWAQSPAHQDSKAPVATGTEQRVVEGWTVHVDVTLVHGPHKELGDRALTMLGNHLQRVEILVPAPALEKLKEVEFRLDRKHPSIPTTCYHPSEGWLVRNGHERSLAKKIHLPQANVLVSKQQMLKHPAFILHELAHAYHDQVLGFDHPEIRRAFDAAKQSGRYEKISDHRGQLVTHYGMNNAKEYFAESTEAYFYRNDFYPFLRAELKEFDPNMEALVGRVWGDRN